MRDEYYEIQKIGIVSSKLISRRSISSQMIKFTTKIPFNSIVNQHCSVCKILPPPPPRPQGIQRGVDGGCKAEHRKTHVHNEIFKRLLFCNSGILTCSKRYPHK